MANNCIICFGESPSFVILNSGLTLCRDCVDKIMVCPLTKFKITTNVPNTFAINFFRIQPQFKVEDLLKSSDKIKYMNQFNEIELNDIGFLINDDDDSFILNNDEFKVFVDKCVNLECTDEYEKRIIHYVCACGNYEMLEYLVNKNVDIFCANDAGEQPIHTACMNNLEMVKYLVSRGADLHSVTGDGMHPIHFACCSEKVDNVIQIVKYLLENGADINCTNDDNCRPIHFAINMGSIELLKLFIDYGADLNCSDSYNYRIIHFACRGGDKSLELIKFLISHNVELECTDMNLWQPIHYACSTNALELVKLFISKGVDTEKKSINGKLPSDLTENVEIRKLLGR